MLGGIFRLSCHWSREWRHSGLVMLAVQRKVGLVKELRAPPTGSIAQRPRIVRRGVARAPAAASKKSASGPMHPLWIYFSSQSASKHVTQVLLLHVNPYRSHIKSEPHWLGEIMDLYIPL